MAGIYRSLFISFSVCIFLAAKHSWVLVVACGIGTDSLAPPLVTTEMTIDVSKKNTSGLDTEVFIYLKTKASEISVKHTLDVSPKRC